MGKTSFLLQLQNLLGGSFICVFCDMMGAGADQSDGRFFYYLADAIYKQTSRQPGVEGISEPKLSLYEEYPYDIFIPWLEDEIMPLLGTRVLFITIDEFELIGQGVKEGRLTLKVYEKLRHMMQHFSEKVCLLFAGVEDLSVLGADAPSYFIGAHAIEISYLDSKAAMELVCNPDENAGKMPAYTDSVVDEILRITRCQPFLLQAVCSEIIEIANRDKLSQIEISHLTEAVDKVFSTYAFYFQSVWQKVTDDGQALLAHIAHEPMILAKDTLEKGYFAYLTRNRVIRAGVDGKYEIEIPLMKSWVKQQTG